MAVTADYANLTVDGKVNIMGLFSQIVVLPENPVLPQMFVVFAMEAEDDDYGAQRQLRLEFVNPSGERVVPDIEAQLPAPVRQPGNERLVLNQIVGLSGIRFSEAGEYRVRLMLDDEVVVIVPLWVRQQVAADQVLSGMGQ